VQLLCREKTPGFISAVQQAGAGRVVVLCFQGTPDMEHAACGTNPDLFEDMIDYLKDNNYKVIAMRDDAAQWKSNVGTAAASAAKGNSDTILNFYTGGRFEVTREAAGDFTLSQLNFGSSCVTLTNKGALKCP
jgi:hypothetical protein